LGLGAEYATKDKKTNYFIYPFTKSQWYYQRLANKVLLVKKALYDLMKI
jgi:hypothetical protein